VSPLPSPGGHATDPAIAATIAALNSQLQAIADRKLQLRELRRGHLAAAEEKIERWVTDDYRPTTAFDRMWGADPSDNEHNFRVAYTVDVALLHAGLRPGEWDPKKVENAKTFISVMRQRTDADSESLVLRDAERYLFGIFGTERLRKWIKDNYQQSKDTQVSKGAGAPKASAREHKGQPSEDPAAPPSKMHAILADWVWKSVNLNWFDGRGLIDGYEWVKVYEASLNAEIDLRIGKPSKIGWLTDHPPSRPGGVAWAYYGVRRYEVAHGPVAEDPSARLMPTTDPFIFEVDGPFVELPAEARLYQSVGYSPGVVPWWNDHMLK
jgi:hypothetical protein